MPRLKLQRPTLTRMEVVAVLYGILLSLACLARGAIHEVIIALIVLFSLPLLMFALSAVRGVQPMLLKLMLLLFCTMLVVLCLQLLLPSWGPAKQFWQQGLPLIQSEDSALFFYNKSAWLQGVGRMLLLLSACILALCIGSTEASARLFLNSVMLSGGFFLTITFFMTAANGFGNTNSGVYRHGFLSANSAAAYLGLMLLMAVTQAGRLFRQTNRQLRKLLPDIIDKLNLTVLLQGFFMLFCLFLFLAGLFTTSSRGGILLTMLSVLLLFLIAAIKMNLNAHIRKRRIFWMLLVLVGVLLWTFLNFGHIVARKFEREGLQPHSRLEIITSVVPMVVDHLWLGVGLGNFAGVYQQYRAKNVSADGIIDKAHNSYIEFATEFGLPAFLVLVVVVGCVGYQLLQGILRRRERYVLPALGFSAWLLVALHSLFDFPLQVPALAALYISTILVCASQSDPRLSDPPSGERPVPLNRVRIRKRKSSNF